MRYTTDFSIEEKYTYLDGLGNHHQSEAFPGAVAFVNPYPKQAPYGCRTEKISGTAFVAPRAENLQTYTYRSQSSYDHSEFKPWHHELETANPAEPTKFTPNGYWSSDFPSVSEGDWTEQHLLGSNGNARQKNGVALWDGEALIVPQSGALDITTELGRLIITRLDTTLCNAAFDHHDPSLYCVLQARAYGKEPFTSVLEFVLAGSRWEATEDTLRVPWYHRNTMSEIIFPVIDDPALPSNGGTNFGPFAGWMNAAMVPHRQTEEEYQLYLNQDTSKP
ncbi:uncharacterized protein Triagg1_4331 [Trichoderma aggressivum f. europaeum]|uniref:homogentisate 1,2-dioxygenase n=1 Tax=Trichoderma aggressivum f. europaeum TaxID=173218 RepID=A0AAE1IF21_9HYPO|nr:hypothetical protein Triagg1_4331 [Trichoderma aggressivum f. europaeum]